jgi:rhamnose transport system substrate-binding protein
MRERSVLRVAAGALAAFLVLIAGCGKKEAAAPDATGAALRIGIVAKSLGNGFFDAVHKGADEAARELDVKIIFTGPPTPTAEGQIEVINALTAQHVDAIAVSANDPDALVPALQRAMQRGIKVISYDSAVAPAGRNLHLAPSSDALIGETCAQLAARAAPNGTGKIAVVSATPTSTNQNAWLAQMKSALTQFPGLQLVAVVYGDDVSDKSYREAVGLLKRYPDLAAIVSLSSVGIVATAKAVEDQGLAGKVRVTGLGLPGELAGYVNGGVVPEFAIWNPIDLGYATTQVATALARGTSSAAGQSVAAGRMGAITFGADGVGAMAKPFVYDRGNVNEFAKVF